MENIYIVRRVVNGVFGTIKGVYRSENDAMIMASRYENSPTTLSDTKYEVQRYQVN